MVGIRIKNQRGITLMEILVTMAIVAGIGSLIGLFGLDISDFQTFYGDSLLIQHELTLTLRILGSELRAAGSADHGGYLIAAASSSSFTFYSDTDSNGKFEQIRYFLDGTTFKRGVTKSSGFPAAYPVASESLQEVTHDVISSNIFKFYDGTYTGTQAPLPSPVDVSKIRMVRTSLTVDRNPLLPPGPTTGTANTTIRYLRIPP